MKTHYCLLLLILFTSCSKDEDIPTVIIPQEKIKINAISISNENTYSLELNGSFTNDENVEITESGFILNTSGDPTLDDNTLKVASFNDNYTLKSYILSLAHNKTIYIKAYIKTKDKTFYSPILVHTTLEDIPFNLTEDLTFSTQDQINEFASHHYTSILDNGSFSITITGTVNDLSPLINLEIIDAPFFTIKNSLITSLKGLNSLRSINSKFEISQNENLVELTGLDNLQNCWGDFSIIDNPNLKTFGSLAKMTLVEGMFIIKGNSNLENFNGLNKLRAVFQIVIMENAKLKNLTGLENLSVISGDGFDIADNQSLESLVGLTSLKKAGRLYIGKNPKLKNLNGLENLEECAYSLDIFKNDDLENLTGLSNLKMTGFFVVSENSKLLSLNGVEHLENTSDNNLVRIYNNSNLNNFCAIKGYLKKTGYSAKIYNNFSNPTTETILSSCP